MRFYNTLKRKNEEFIPISGNKVKFYVCGPTVYDYCHMGHARTYVFFDLVRRYLEYKGYTVIFVMNITDVDDKIINRAKEMGIDPLKLSKKFTDLFYEDLALLNIKKANIHPKVSEHMDEIIDIIKDLVEKGFGYEVDGNVYFSMDKVSAFGKLSKQSFDELLVGARVEPDPRKKNPKDFALWKKSKEGEIGWHSPWGIGRPGWHIECSTMSMEYLGSTLDIHGGGMDLIFPHHECEILQSEAYTGKEFVRYWLHTGLLTIDKEKMSKSLGNFFTIKEVLEKYEPDVVRFFLLNAHYRSPLDFSDRALDEARESLERIRNFVSLVAEIL
ncbi:MAG: cysteine--tRNA ligase, partial [Candidatus Thermoplasmatota archaeon]